MVDRWAKRYSHAPGSRAVIEQVVQEWFEQELMEAVMGAQALRGSAQWTVEDFDRILSEEALTAVVLPRYHIDNNIKRALGAKLGTLKEMKEKEKAASEIAHHTRRYELEGRPRGRPSHLSGSRWDELLR